MARAPLPSAEDLDPATLTPLLNQLADGDIKGCCASVYEHPAVRWLLGGELHPGGESLTRRCFELLELGPTTRLLDIASGTGATALLAGTEHGCEVVGLDYGSSAVTEANRKAADLALGRVSFVQGDAEALPFEDASFDAIICECALCTFPDKATAVAEMRRVLRPGGQIVVTDVVADHARLPAELSSSMATIACVGSALDEAGYVELFEAEGFVMGAVESRRDDCARLNDRVIDRLRGAKILGIAGLATFAGGLEESITMARTARQAIDDGVMDYRVFPAQLPGSSA